MREADRGKHTQDQTYTVITRWSAGTQIEYRPFAKAPGTDAGRRYAKYSRAKTVGESHSLGADPRDWCWDWERGFIRVIEGALEEPNFLSKGDGADLTEVDKIMQRWFKKEAANVLGISLEQVSQQPGVAFARLQRMTANRKAEKILEEAEREGRKLSSADVLTVLQLWSFDKNTYRQNVLPDGADFVMSENIGLTITKFGAPVVAAKTKDFPHFATMLAKYLQDHLPPEVGEYVFTSISVNKNYAAKLHRDSRNVGPSFIQFRTQSRPKQPQTVLEKAFGNFSGGELEYFPNDDGSVKDPKDGDLPEWDAVKLDLKGHLLLFDGRRAHRVRDFDGQRYSLVWYSSAKVENLGEESRRLLVRCGFHLPTTGWEERCKTILAPPCGYAPDPDGRVRPEPKGLQLRRWRLPEGASSAGDSAAACAVGASATPRSAASSASGQRAAPTKRKRGHGS